MKCIYCDVEMDKGTMPFHIDRKGLHLMLDEVPAWICPQCGEGYLEEEQVKIIQSIVEIIESRQKELARIA